MSYHMTEAHPSSDFKQGIRNRLSFLTNITQNWHLYKTNSFYNSDDSLWEECIVTNFEGILSWLGVQILSIWHCFQELLVKWSLSHRKPKDFQLLLMDSWGARWGRNVISAICNGLVGINSMIGIWGKRYFCFYLFN